MPTPAAAKAVPKKATEPPVARGAVHETGVRLRDLDPEPAAGVRAVADDAATADYATADRETPGCLPPLEVFAGPTASHPADGGTRLQALTGNRRVTDKARVRRLPADDAARLAAVLFAGAANTAHGRRRRNADKRRAVEPCRTTPALGVTGDPNAAAACRVDKWLVEAVRLALTEAGRLQGRASAEGRYAAAAGRSCDQAGKEEPPSADGGQKHGTGRYDPEADAQAVVRDDRPVTSNDGANESAGGTPLRRESPPDRAPTAPAGRG